MPGTTGGHGAQPAQPRALDQGGPPPARPLHRAGGPLSLPAPTQRTHGLRTLFLPTQVRLELEGGSRVEEFPGKILIVISNCKFQMLSWMSIKIMSSCPLLHTLTRPEISQYFGEKRNWSP